jgi:hypothetical protein
VVSETTCSLIPPGAPTIFSRIATLSARRLVGMVSPVRRARRSARDRSGDVVRKPYRSTDDDVSIVAERLQRSGRSTARVSIWSWS